MPDQQSNILDGDASFAGVNQLLAPADLKPGEVADARNARFRFGKPEPRLGVVKLPWTNKLTGSPTATPIPFGEVYGAGVFRDADDIQWGIIAADGKVFRTREGSGAAEIALPSGVTLAAPISFTQTQNGLWMFRGLNADKLLMKTLDLGFAVPALETNAITGVLTENQADGSSATPNAERGDWIGNRLFTPYTTSTEKDLVDVSDYLNSTRTAGVRSQARINQGSSDALLRVFQFGKVNTAVCFKTASVYALNNVVFALSDMTLSPVSQTLGLCSPRAVVNVGKEESDLSDEVWFLAKNVGVCRITYDQDGRLGVTQVPISDEIHKTIARINWSVAVTKATAEVWDNKVYFAVPLDDARVRSPQLNSGSSLFVIPGAYYYFIPASASDTLTNGTEVLTSEGEFTPQKTQVTLSGGGAIYRVWKNVNTAVLVFDLLKGKWCGPDTGRALLVKEWLRLPFDGEDRLFFIGEDGFINLMEYVPYDETAQENVGVNLTVDAGAYDASGRVSFAVTRGRHYAYRFDTNTSQLINGTQTITTAPGTFVAQSDTITYVGTPLTVFSCGTHLIDWTLGQEWIDFLCDTRLYRWGTLKPKTAPWLNLVLNTWKPRYTLSAMRDGYNEIWALRSARERDNTLYRYPHTAQRWDASNYNDDHGTRGREDYSVTLGDETVSSGSIAPGLRYAVQSSDVVTACSIIYNGVTYNNNDTFLGVDGVTTFTVNTGTPVVYAPGSYVLPGENGIVFDAHQTLPLSVKLDRRLHGLQLRLTNDQGRAGIVSVEVEGRLTQEHKGTRQV